MSLSPLRSNAPSPLVSPFLKLPETLFTKDFDSWEIDEPFVLKNIARAIFEELFLESQWLQDNMDKTACGRFVDLVSKHYYQTNPFHNFQHAVNVLHAVHLLLHSLSCKAKVNDTMHLALYIAALCHDVEHPGHSNEWEIRNFTPLAQLYNDMHVLEQHHAHTTFRLLEQSKWLTNIQQCITDFRLFRRTIIDSILHTDMAMHDKVMELCRKGDWMQLPHLVSELPMILLHFADLISPCKEFTVAWKWATAIAKEQQSLGEDNNILAFCIGERGFLTHIVVPMWTEMVNQQPSLQWVLHQLSDNVKQWCAHIEELETTSKEHYLVNAC